MNDKTKRRINVPVLGASMVLALVVITYLVLWMLRAKVSVTAAQIINYIVLIDIVLLSILAVGRDVRKRRRSWLETTAWVIVSTATFPIGFGLYFLIRERIYRITEMTR